MQVRPLWLIVASPLLSGLTFLTAQAWLDQRAWLFATVLGAVMVPGLIVALLFNAYSTTPFHTTVSGRHVTGMLAMASTLALLVPAWLRLFWAVPAGLSATSTDQDFDAMYDAITMAVAPTLLGVGVWLLLREITARSIERHLPTYLNALAEGVGGGLSIPRAIETTSKRSWGALTPLQEYVAKQVAWGRSLPDALQSTRQMTRDPMFQQTMDLLGLVHRHGGDIAPILRSAADRLGELQTVARERDANLVTYMVIGVMMFATSTFIIGQMLLGFIPPLTELQSDPDTAGASIFRIDPLVVPYLYWVLLVQAIGGGLISGLLGRRSWATGFLIAGLQVVAPWLLFRVMQS